MLEAMKTEGRIVGYSVNGNDVSISPVVPVERIHVNFEIVLPEGKKELL